MSRRAVGCQGLGRLVRIVRFTRLCVPKSTYGYLYEPCGSETIHERLCLAAFGVDFGVEKGSFRWEVHKRTHQKELDHPEVHRIVTSMQVMQVQIGMEPIY